MRPLNGELFIVGIFEDPFAFVELDAIFAADALAGGGLDVDVGFDGFG